MYEIQRKRTDWQTVAGQESELTVLQVKAKANEATRKMAEETAAKQVEEETAAVQKAAGATALVKYQKQVGRRKD